MPEINGAGPPLTSQGLGSPLEPGVSDGVDAPRRQRCAKVEGVEAPLQRGASRGEVSTIGLDLAKNVFQAHGAGADGSVVRRKLLRAQLLKFIAAQPRPVPPAPRPLPLKSGRWGCPPDGHACPPFTHRSTCLPAPVNTVVEEHLEPGVSESHRQRDHRGSNLAWPCAAVSGAKSLH
jgi:hypothetical protein